MVRADRHIDMGEILSILNAIAGQLDFRAVIHAVSNEIKVLLPHDHLDVALLSGDGSMVTAYETGLHTEWDEATTDKTPTAISPIRDLFSGKADNIITDNAQVDPRFHFKGAFSTAIFAAGLKSRLHVPLMVEARVVGALSFSTQEVGTYRPSDVQDARVVADILAPYFFALQQSKLLRQTELQQVEAEARAEGLRTGALHLTDELENARQAIGMDLHDQTLADLSRLSRGLRRFGTRTTFRGEELEPLLEDIEHCIRELRVIIDNAKPSVLQFFGFGEAVETTLERSVSSSPSPIGYKLVDGTEGRIDQLPPTIQVALYRIVQEAINNAVRHSGARLIRVDMTSCDTAVQICIEDDGTGLAEISKRRASGMNNMFTRASLIEAELEARTGADGRGTILELKMPIPHEAKIELEGDLTR